jgi:Amt family ammonium transporter
LVKQVSAILLAVVYSFTFTLFLLKGINWLIPVKASAREEKEGLDISYHGEIARDAS